jgi:ABC-type multidrug transport system ATPase subunit/ABC-type multidrug transport system permease subunit
VKVNATASAAGWPGRGYAWRVLVARDVEVSVAGGIRILGPLSLELAPGTLVALMGPSGSGKSTLLEILAGVSEPSAGTAAWDGAPTAEAVHLAGYVPQRESVHDRLTPREALHYAARLRLDALAAVDRRVSMVLEELDLSPQADTPIRNLSGGERRRTACGLELVGEPCVLLLDEPTSGLDAVLERRLMILFRRLADHGRAVMVATHATASLDLCDEVLVLDAGRAVHRGTPASARAHLAGLARDGRMSRAAAELDHPRPALPAAPTAPTPPPATRRNFTLELAAFAGRYLRTLLRERQTLYLQLAQAPLIAILIAIVFHPNALDPASGTPADAVELTFMLMTASIWLGVSASTREVVKERGLVEREFDVGARLDAYLAAKAAVLFALTAAQTVLLVGVTLALQPLHGAPSGALEVLGLCVLSAWASVAMGLVVSALARTVDQAAGAIPLLLMPQLLFAGALIPLAQMPAPIRVLADVTYARWAYAGLGSAANINGRLAAAAGSALGFDTSFFSLAPGSAAIALLAFTLVLLLAALLALARRPALER